MITRHGRSASTVSSVLPNSDAPSTRRGSGMTIAAARISTASSTIRRARLAGADRSQWPDTRRPPATLASSMTLRALASCVGHRRVDRQRARHRDRHERRGCRGACARRACAAVASTCRRSPSRRSATSTESYSASWSTTGCGIATLCVERQVEALPAAVDDVDDDAERQPADAEHADDRVQRRDHDERDEGERPADDREQRRVVAADGRVARAAVGPRDVRLLRPQPDHRGVGDRERQHRAERVDVAEEGLLARQDRGDRDAPRRPGSRSTACGTSGAAGAAGRAAGGGCPSSTPAARRR